jgi:hypothetical protein
MYVRVFVCVGGGGVSMCAGNTKANINKNCQFSYS